MSRLLLILLLFFNVELYCQVRQWKLDDCIEYAKMHNSEMQNKKLSADVSLIDVAEAKWKYAPSISASNNYSISQGRVLDQTTYDFIENKTVFGNSTSISASISLFNGLKNLAFLKKSKLLSATATLNVEKFENDLTLAITAQYLNILLAHENILNTRQVLRTLDVQRETISKMVVVGKVTKVDLFQIESKIADAQTNLLSYEHELQSAKLYIYELMGVDDFSEFEFNVCYADSILIAPEQIIPCNYSQCVENLPEIKIAKLNIDVMKQDLQLSRTSLFPSITLSAAYGSSYSDVRQKSFINPDGTYRYEKYPFSEQYKDNFNGYLSIGVEVPIFNGLSVNKKIKRSKIAIQQAEHSCNAIKRGAEKELNLAILDMNTAWQKYDYTQKYLNYAEETLRQISKKYSLGASNLSEYNSALDSYVSALSKHSIAKYEYFFKSKIVELYIQPWNCTTEY